MPQDLVQGAVQFGTARDQNDGAAIFLEHVVNVSQGPEVIRQMLNDVQANYGVEFFFQGIGVVLLPIRIAHAEIGMVGNQVFQIRQIVRIDIAGIIELSGNQLQRQIPRARANFKDPLADVGPNESAIHRVKRGARFNLPRIWLPYSSSEYT